jgi:DNA-binding NarL/FixJ family response regulator
MIKEDSSLENIIDSVYKLNIKYVSPLDRFKKLTFSERDIIGYLTDGFSTSEIAKYRKCSAYTIRNHFRNIFTKLNVHSRVQLVSLILKNEEDYKTIR